MLEILKVGTAGLVIYEGFKCLGKREYSEVVAFTTVVNVGFGVFFKLNGWYSGVATWYNGLMNSRIIEMIDKIF